MTVVFRAYSPSRNEATTTGDDKGWAHGVAATRNQLAATHPDQHADWTVQTGHVEWETP